jgi:capsid protein
MIFHGKPGEKIEGIERNIPGRNLVDCLTMFLRLMGLPLGIPLEIILLDWTKSNYSQSRAVLEQAYQSFTGWQDLFEYSFHNKVLEWKIESAIKTRELKNVPDDYLKHEWIKPTFPWLDQLKEAQAQAAKLDRTFSTHGEICKSLGRERADIIAVRENEIRESIKIAQKIKADTGTDVPWQIFAGLETKTESPKAAVTEEPEADGDKKENASDDK